jgi:hypothetical protein
MSEIFVQSDDVTAIKNVRKILDRSVGEAISRNRQEIDFGKLSPILSILKTILNSKPILKSGKTSREDKDNFLKKISAKIFEAFLKTIPDSGNVRFDLGLLGPML